MSEFVSKPSTGVRSFFRGSASFILLVVGAALSLFSVAVAIGWDYGPFSLAGIFVAVVGLYLAFSGYRLLERQIRSHLWRCTCRYFSGAAAVCF